MGVASLAAPVVGKCKCDRAKNTEVTVWLEARCAVSLIIGALY